jgi:hypothetical protein
MDQKPRKDVVALPVRRASRGNATRFEVARWKMREWLGRLANRLGLPGAIAEMDVADAVTGQRLSVRVGPLFVVLGVDGRDYYFWRFSGRHDGTGACADSSSPACYSGV